MTITRHHQRDKDTTASATYSDCDLSFVAGMLSTHFTGFRMRRTNEADGPGPRA